MTYDKADELKSNNIDFDNAPNIDMKANEVKDANIRKRIDNLLEKKRLKELLNDTDDW